jgi:ABC-type transport system involved in cytochrome c biogenesis permease subunit
MHDESLNPETLSPAAMEQAAIEQLDQRLIRALEAVPEPHIPANFAARVASRLPARRPVSLTPTHYGYTATLIGLVLTLAALLVVALHTTGRPTFGLPEAFLLTQFIVLAVWFSVQRHSLR